MVLLARRQDGALYVNCASLGSDASAVVDLRIRFRVQSDTLLNTMRRCIVLTAALVSVATSFLPSQPLIALRHPYKTALKSSLPPIDEPPPECLEPIVPSSLEKVQEVNENTTGVVQQPSTPESAPPPENDLSVEEEDTDDGDEKDPSRTTTTTQDTVLRPSTSFTSPLTKDSGGSSSSPASLPDGKAVKDRILGDSNKILSWAKSNQAQLEAETKAELEKQQQCLSPLFQFDAANRNESLSRWERIDDVIMGGISTSSLLNEGPKVNPESVVFRGIVREEGGGFCGQRSKLLSEPLNLSE